MVDDEEVGPAKGRFELPFWSKPPLIGGGIGLWFWLLFTLAYLTNALAIAGHTAAAFGVGAPLCAAIGMTIGSFIYLVWKYGL